MTVKYCIKTHNLTINDTVNKYYSSPALNAVLATGEKFFVTAVASHVTGVSASLGVNIELSNDNVNWTLRSAVISAFVTVGGTTVLSGSELGTTTVGGRFMRVSAAMGGTPAAGFIEVWVSGRSFV